MPACGQAVGCGVCDTPELWCGAAGLCARVRACAGAAESLHTCMHRDAEVAPPPAVTICIYVCVCKQSAAPVHDTYVDCVPSVPRVNPRW